MKSNPDKMSIWDLKLIFDFSKVSQLMMSNKLHIFRNLGYAYKCTYCVSLMYFFFVCVFTENLPFCQPLFCNFILRVNFLLMVVIFDPIWLFLHHLISLGLYMMIYFFTYLCKIRHIQSMVWICMCLLVVLRFFFVLNRTNITVHLTIHNRLTNLAIFCRFSLYKATFSITRYQL